MGLLNRLFLSSSFALAVFIAGAQSSEDDFKYRRNSIVSIMINHPEYKFGDEIEAIFKQLPTPTRFNDHNLGVRSVMFGSSDRKDQKENIDRFNKEVNLAQKIVARWFKRDKATGGFCMDLVSERGVYDASYDDVAKAKASARGLALLKDAGEELIPNTYVIFNDIIYNSRSGIGSILKIAGNVYIGNIDGVQNNMQEIAGFKVTIKSYLYKLVWNNEIAERFYSDYYFEQSAPDAAKKRLFESEHDFFTLQYVGVTESTNQHTSFVGVKDPREALRKICARVIDRNISDLQHAFPDFRIKAPLLSTSPLMADVGLKEGITEDSRFEVLMPETDSNGILKYKRVGIIRPVKGKIKDNRYMAVEEGAEKSELTATEFESTSGSDFLPGMLIREM